jgi:hypothetical protein
MVERGGARVAAVAVVLGVGACVPVRYTEVFSPEGEVSRVLLEVDQGGVEIVPADAVRVERAVRGPEGAAELRHELRRDGTLVLTARCPGVLPCGVDTRIAVPPGLPVTVALGEGEVWATGLDDLQLDIAEGSADVEVRGRFVAVVGSGDVRAWLGPTSAARVAVGRGDVDVVVPPGMYALDLTARSWQVEGITPDEDAPGQIEVVAPSGRARVRGGQGVARR